MPKQISAQQSISVLASADVTAIRTETLADKEFMVVPIIALVEGVWQGAVADNPELALASEFGKVPESWNGRPITLGHPKRTDDKGVTNFVSAGSPDVFEKEVIGTIYNTNVTDKKLKVEAWIDNEKVDQVGEPAQLMVQRLKSGEMVEVSTGLFMNLEDTVGIFNGEEFTGIWRNIVPDHLALLDEGVLGACSVADGAGAPRLNQLRTMSKGTSMSKDKSGKMNINAAAFKRILEAAGEFKIRNQAAISSKDAATAVEAALSLEEEVDGGYWVIAIFPDTVVYLKGWDCTLYQRSYSAADTGAVSLGATVTAVRPVTTFVPIEVTIEGDPNMAVQEKVAALLNAKKDVFQEADKAWLEKLPEDQLDKLLASAKQPEVAVHSETATASEAGKGSDKLAGLEVKIDVQAAKPETVETFLDKAPSEIREVLNEGLQIQRQAKEDCIAKLRGNERCEFAEDELRAMNLQQLNRLAKLANVPSYAGKAGTSVPTVNAAPEPNYTPAPKVFESKAQK